MKKKCRRLGAALLTGICFLCVSICNGQSLSPPVSVVDNLPLAAITFANAKSLKTKAGLSDLISINPDETVSIQLQFPPALAGTPVIIEVLDGGAISAANQNSAIGADGGTSLQFQAGLKPGVYRMVINAGSTVSILQFWVPNATNPAANPPTLKP